jgi:hypothetical protein
MGEITEKKLEKESHFRKLANATQAQKKRYIEKGNYCDRCNEKCNVYHSSGSKFEDLFKNKREKDFFKVTKQLSF